uniref:U24-Theriditoxin-Lha1d_1 n=1 Tax=Latrodectus hasselti TaxID=256736 RepID=A0A482ZIU4_LATHA
MKFIINIFAFITVFMEVHSMHISHSDSILHSSESTLKHTDADRVVKRDEPGVCQTDACKKTAEHILQSMDNKVNPCDDFYQFACGGWIEGHSIPDDKSSASIFEGVEDDLNLKLKELLERPLSGSEPRHIQMMKQFYDSCMDTNSIEASGSEPLKNILQKFGGWPVVVGDSWDESKFDWMDTLIAMRNFGFSHNILLSLYVSPDTKDNTVNIIELDQTNLGMPSRDYLVSGLSDDATAAYFNLMVKSANKLGADESKSKKD